MYQHSTRKARILKRPAVLEEKTETLVSLEETEENGVTVEEGLKSEIDHHDEENIDSEQALARAWLDTIDVSSGEEEEDANEGCWFGLEHPVKNEPTDTDEDTSKHHDGENDEYMFICPAPGCGETFPSEIEARLHSAEHDAPQYTCDECGEVFSTSPELEEHELTHPELMVRCDDCDEEVPKRVFQEHSEKHEQKHKCPNCEKVFARPQKLKMHVQKCLEEVSGPALGAQQRCKICSESITVSLMLKHLKEHALEEVETWGVADEESITCKRCQRVLDSKYKALNHILGHYLPDRTFECNICCYPSSSKSLSEWHSRHVCAQERKEFLKTGTLAKGKKGKRQKGGAPESDTVVCDLCNKVLKRGSLANHKAIVHKEVVEVYKCRLCEKVYYSKPNLKFHLDTVHRMKNPVFPCGTCRKLFHSAQARSEHTRSAHTPKRIRCTICDLEMVYYSAKCHYLRHAWEMLGMTEATSDTFGFFPCPKCDRTFSYAQHVVNHLVNHFQPQRIFECDKCFLALSTQSLLAKHRLACNGFAAESDMKRSWKKIGVRVPSKRGRQSEAYTVHLHKWQCEKCEKLFDTEEECEEHIRATHENEEETIDGSGNVFFVYAAE